MTTNHHTVIATGAAANASVFNAPLAQLDTAITTNAASIVANALLAAATTAEVVTARSPYVSLDARLDAIEVAGSGASTQANGVANAGQKVITVDATTGFLSGAPVSYTLVSGVVETNVVDTVDSPTQLTLITNIGASGIANNTFIMVINLGALVSTGAIAGASAQQQQFDKGLLIPSTAGTTAKWAVKPTYVTNSGTRDELLFNGWNVNSHSGGRIDTSEASIYTGFEANYYVVGSGKNFCEWYVEFYSATGAIQRRSFSTSIDRANGDITNQYWGQHIFYKSDGTLAWQIDTAGNLSSANLVRFTQNNGIVLTQLNTAGLAYVSLIQLLTGDIVYLGDSASPVHMAYSSAAKVGIGEPVPDSKLHIGQRDAGTNAIVQMATISRNSSGVVAAGFGSSLLFELGDTGADDTKVAKIDALWNTATNGATKGDLVLSAYDTAAREGLRIRGNGSLPAIGFYGVAPIERALLATGAGATVDNVITALQNLGLVKQS